MRVRVLGSAAGGGFPQWNCGCFNCRGVREGSINARARTQESVAVSADGASWFLVNASPEIRQQIEAFPALHPRAPRDSPIQGLILTNGDLDHCLGLLSLRESHPLTFYATESVRRGFAERNAVYRTLERFPGQVAWQTLTPRVERDLLLPGGAKSGLTIAAIPVPGKPPLHLEGLVECGPEENVAVRIRERTTGRTLAYASAVGAVTDDVREALHGASAVFFDGTFWSEDELIASGVGSQRAERMAHIPVGGPAGSLERLRDVDAPRRIYIHVNNTNPVLREDSPERAQVAAAGWEIACDGMEVAV